MKRSWTSHARLMVGLEHAPMDTGPRPADDLLDIARAIVVNEGSADFSLREVAREQGVEESVLDEALDYRAMAKPHG